MIPYEGSFVCVLDFYVHYSVQRHGIGSRLFEFMMENERIDAPHQIAFDNPSVALLRFLYKKYDLDNPIWQNTNFVVFSQLFAVAENLSSEDGIKFNVIKFLNYKFIDPAPPEGWQRSATPRLINGASRKTNGARFLDNAISGHPAARKARLRQAESSLTLLTSNLSSSNSHLLNRTLSGDRSERTNASQMQNEARQRKQHVLSSKPLW